MADFPTPIQRVRGRLHRCSFCWKRSHYKATLTGLTDGDEVTGKVDVRLCDDHRREWFDALTSVPHEGTAEFTSGDTLRWSKPDDDAWEA